jgi:hypothetical protein
MMLTLLLGDCLAIPTLGQVPPDTGLPVISIGRRQSVPSIILGDNVDLVVHLPGDYASGGKRYPVLFFLGSDYRAKFALAAASLDYMNAQGQLPGMILVGIDLPHGNFVLVPQESGGGTASADRHIAVLAQEIIPFVDRTFRTNGYSILYGGSNCGVFAVYALLTGRLPCRAYLASSPMLGWCPTLIFDRAREAFADSGRPQRFLFQVWSDDDFSRVTHDMPKFVELLAKNAPNWLRWKSEIRHNEGHVPEMDLSLGLRALFPDYNPETGLMTLQDLQEHYAKLSNRYGFTIEVPEALIFDVGLTLGNSGQLDEAQRVFEYAVERYPQNADMHAGLGFVYKQRGNAAVAAGHLKKALEIVPAHGWARQQLNELQAPK